MQPLMVEMIYNTINVTVITDSQPLNNKHKRENYSLTTIKLTRNAVWHKISSIVSSFANWKLSYKNLQNLFSG